MQSNSAGAARGGPVVLRPVRATPYRTMQVGAADVADMAVVTFRRAVATGAFGRSSNIYLYLPILVATHNE